MLESSARLLRLLSLLQSRRFWAGGELAERLEISARTLRRDVERLRQLGYPIRASSGVAGGYELGPGGSLPPLLLDDEEALAVSLGLRAAAMGPVMGMEEAALRALTKLQQMLPVHLRERMRNLDASVVPLTSGRPLVDPEVLTAVASACRNHVELGFAYRRRDDEEGMRRVQPHAIVHTGLRWYGLVWDLDREDWRTFRIDRIVPPVHERARFVPRTIPGNDAAAFVGRSIGHQLYPVQARVLIHASAESIRGRVSPLAGEVEPIDDTRCMLRAGAHRHDVLLAHVLTLDVDFEVLDPPELRQSLDAWAQRIRRAAAAG